jgi:hypothetical protein
VVVHGEVKAGQRRENRKCQTSKRQKYDPIDSEKQDIHRRLISSLT